MQTLNSLAKAAYTASVTTSDAESAEMEARAAEEFLSVARRCARDVLGEAADVLPWRYTPWAESAEGTEEAIADLAPGRAHSFALHYICTDSSVVFGLAATCVGCGCRTITPVSSLQHLGQLLDEADGQDEQHHDDGATDKPGPLAGIDGLTSAAEQVAQLVRRLVARHPEAGLRVDFASAYGHHAPGGVRGGAGGGSLRLSAKSAETVLDIVQTLDDQAGVKTSTEDSGAWVSRWVTASYSSGEFEVQISGHTRLSDEETAAWRAERHQADTDVTETASSELTPAVDETGGER